MWTRVRGWRERSHNGAAALAPLRDALDHVHHRLDAERLAQHEVGARRGQVGHGGADADARRRRAPDRRARDRAPPSRRRSASSRSSSTSRGRRSSILVQRLGAVGRDRDGEAGVLERGAQRLADLAIVVDDQQSEWIHRTLRSPPRPHCAAAIAQPRGRRYAGPAVKRSSTRTVGRISTRATWPLPAGNNHRIRSSPGGLDGDFGNQQRRYGVAPHLDGAGDADDAGAGALLWRHGAAQERPVDLHALLLRARHRDAAVGRHRLLAGVRQDPLRDHRRLRLRVHARRRARGARTPRRRCRTCCS